MRPPLYELARWVRVWVSELILFRSAWTVAALRGKTRAVALTAKRAMFLKATMMKFWCLMSCVDGCSGGLGCGVKQI